MRKSVSVLAGLALVATMAGCGGGGDDNGGDDTNSQQPPGIAVGPYGVEGGTATYVTANVKSMTLTINYLWSNGQAATVNVRSDEIGPVGNTWTTTLLGDALGLPGETHTITFQTLVNYGFDPFGVRMTIDGQYAKDLSINFKF